MICFVCIEDAVQTLAIFGNGEVNSKIAVIIEKHLDIKVNYRMVYILKVRFLTLEINCFF